MLNIKQSTKFPYFEITLGYVYVCMYISYICIYTCVCVHIYIYIYIYIYIISVTILVTFLPTFQCLDFIVLQQKTKNFGNK